jgi:APA family basic amino acid/polyamine antiporter
MTALPDTQPLPVSTEPPLKRSIGLWMATALVVGNMVGSGVFLLPATLAGEAGPVSIVALALTGVGAMLLALVFAGLAREYPKTGGPYAYARRAFGDFAGFWTAWGYWIAAWAGNAAIAIAFVGYFGVFWNDLTTDTKLAAVVAVALIWLLTAVNLLGTRESGFVQVVTTVLKFVPLAAIGVIGLFYVHRGNYTPFAPESGTGWINDWHINAAATLALWAFIGLESATVPAEEVKDAKRTIVRATIVGTLASTLLYLVALVAIIGILPRAQLANSSSPFAAAADAMWGGAFLGLDWGEWIALVAMASTLGCLNGWILLTARVPLAAARDGLFPKAFARVEGTRNTPVVGLVVSAVLVSGLVLMNYQKSLVDAFTQVILLATLTTLVPYAFSAAAQAWLWLHLRERIAPRRLIGDLVIASLAFAYSVWAIWGAGQEIIAKGFMLLLAGIPVYVWLTWRRPLASETPLTVPEEWTREVSEPLATTVTAKEEG